jgi:hypothetical protein
MDMDPPDEQVDVANLIARFSDGGLSLHDGSEYEWDDTDNHRSYDPYDDLDDIPDMLDYHRGSAVDPFAEDDTKYRFNVVSFTMGSMDGKQLQFYEVRPPLSLASCYLLNPCM